MTYILTYTFAPVYLKKRAPHRSDHFNYLKPYINKKELILGGATQTDSPEGIIIFNNLDKQAVVQFAKNDPYVLNEVVKSYNIKQWNVAAGSLLELII